jgi:hypothetical protein
MIELLLTISSGLGDGDHGLGRGTFTGMLTQVLHSHLARAAERYAETSLDDYEQRRARGWDLVSFNYIYRLPC